MSQHPRSLRIGMLAPGYPSGVAGDYRGIFVQQLVGELKARGHRLCILTSRIRPEDAPLTRVDEAEEIQRFRFWSEGKILAEYERIPLARMMTYITSALVTGRRVFSRFECDLIHSHFLLPTGWIGAALARALGKPHVLSVHGSDMRLVARKKFLRPLSRWTLRHCGAITATANHQLAPLAMLGIAPELVIKMPMGIHEAFLAEPADPAAPEPRKRVISTRTLLDSLYNISQLIRAMKIVAARDPEVTCTVAGSGRDRQALEELARALGLERQVSFSGWADPPRLAEMLRGHRIYVSASRSDGASISLFEAMVSGLYPILSDIPANREWIRQGDNGLLFPLDDPETLARLILETVNNPAASERAIQLNRATALRTFTWPGIASRLEQIYESIL